MSSKTHTLRAPVADHRCEWVVGGLWMDFVVMELVVRVIVGVVARVVRVVRGSGEQCWWWDGGGGDRGNVLCVWPVMVVVVVAYVVRECRWSAADRRMCP